MGHLFDTGVLLHALKGSPAFRGLSADARLDILSFRPVASIITAGELAALGEKNNWGSKKLREIDDLLESVTLLPVDREGIYRIYASLDGQSKREGLNIGQNDLWIAATAIEYRLVVLTFDGDFERTPNPVKYIRFEQTTGERLSERL